MLRKCRFRLCWTQANLLSKQSKKDSLTYFSLARPRSGRRK